MTTAVAATEPAQVDYWQLQSSKFSTPFDRDKHLLETGLYADCEYLVGGDYGTDQEVIKAHRIFLAQSSPVFHAMFFGELAQSALDGKNNLSSAQNEVIAVPDVTPSSFKALLQYIYTLTMNLKSLDQAMGLCYAAQKYILPDLVAKCLQYMGNNLCPKYTLKVMEFTKLFEDKNLKAKCLSMLQDRTLECLAASNFEDAHESTVLTIVKEGALNIRELELFDAVIRWAKRQCTERNQEINGTNMRQEIINEIHFLSMTPEEFASSPVHSGVLTENEWATILVHLNNPDSSLPMPIHLSTNRNQRHCKSVASRSNNEIQCLREITNETRVLLDSSFFSYATVTVDKNVMVTGIIIANTDLSNSQRSRYSEMVVMCHLYDNDGSLKAFARVSEPMTYRSTTFLPVFDRPVQLEQYKTYRIRIAIDQRANFLLGTASRSVSCQGVNFQFSDDPDDEDRNNGLVRGLTFYPCSSK